MEPVNNLHSTTLDAAGASFVLPIFLGRERGDCCLLPFSPFSIFFSGREGREERQIGLVLPLCTLRTAKTRYLYTSEHTILTETKHHEAECHAQCVLGCKTRLLTKKKETIKNLKGH